MYRRLKKQGNCLYTDVAECTVQPLNTVCALTLTLFSFLFLLLFAATALGQSREVIQYRYDESGNIVDISTDVSQAPPTVSSIAPDVMRVGATQSVRISGTDLANAIVSSDDVNLVVGETSSSSEEIIFDLSANVGTLVGLHTLSVITSLGSATIDINIEPQLPRLVISPLPLVIADGGSAPLGISLSNADVQEQTFTLSIAFGASIATLSQTSITIPAGQTEPLVPVIVSSIARGVANIDVSSPAFGNFSLSVFVTAEAQLPLGLNRFYSAPLGVTLQASPEPPDIITLGPFRTELRVLKEVDTTTTDENLRSPFVSQVLRVIKGSGITSVAPRSLLEGSGPTDIVVNGFALDAVDSLTLVPDDGLLVGDITISPDGLSVSAPVTVAPGVAFTQRQVSLSAAGQNINPVSIGAGRVFIGGQVPVIDSVEPQDAHRDNTTNLVVRGQNFQRVESVTINPAEGISLAAPPSASDDGSEISLAMTIAESAELGPRLVTVTTPTGTSSGVVSPANTFVVTARPGDPITPIVAARVGVVLQEDDGGPQDRDLTQYAFNLGVSKGAVLTDLQPAAQAIDTTFTLTLSGSSLQDVDQIEFIPNTGITTGALSAASSGDEVTVEITIAADAPQTTRRVNVLRGATAVPTGFGANDRFRVTAPQPIIQSLSPNFLLANNTPQTVTVRGQLLNDLQQIRIEPAAGIIFNTPQVSAEGDAITVEVTVDASATTGPRRMVVETLGGETDTTLTPANTINIASSIEDVFASFVAPAVGVEKTAPVEPPGSVTIGLNSLIVGVALGPFANQLIPAAVSIDTSVNLTISGAELDDVTSITLEPDTGVVLGSLTIATDQITVPMTIASDAPQTPRRVIINTATSVIPFSDDAGGRLQIAGPVATIDSIAPIQQVPSANFNLVISGSNLQTTQSVRMLPADSHISVGIPSANTAGTEVTVQVNLSETVTPGPRVVVVTTLAGDTSTVALPENTFNVVN